MPAASDPAPLILTLKLDDAAFGFFDSLRRAHYPAERNVVPAHLTLFHQLPAARRRDIETYLAALAFRQKPLPLRVEKVSDLGGAVVFAIRSPALLALRDVLAEEWLPWLSDQDRAGFRPHVTVQNKVPAKAAARLAQRLSAEFTAFAADGQGLVLWRYDGGPWTLLRQFRFAGR